MRLINIHSLQLEEFVGDAVPPYAILSHMWGAGEISFQEMRNHNQRAATGVDASGMAGLPALKPGGWRKVVGTCELVRSRYAAENEVQHVWIDTCCIDKSSSAELQEAINSMFRWYERSEICIAYLSDVKYAGFGPDFHLIGEVIVKSRWFTRGWTLQELLAPRLLYFYDADWKPLKALEFVAGPISKRTGIGARYLTMQSITSASVAERFSWAAGRQTTRIEDRAYSLLGIFDISMPLLYGEGEKAFARLQEEIMKVNDDPSILAWGNVLIPKQHTFVCELSAVRPVMLARDPDDFAHCRQMQLEPYEATGHSIQNPLRPRFSVVPRGLQIAFPMVQAIESSGGIQPVLFVLGAVREATSNNKGTPCKEVIVLPSFRLTNDLCVRMPWANPQRLPASFLSEIGQIVYQEVILARPTSREVPTWIFRPFLNVSALLTSRGSVCSLTDVYPYPQMASQKLLESTSEEATTTGGSGIAGVIRTTAAETARGLTRRGSRHRFIACGECETGGFCSGTVFYRLELSASERVFAVAISFKFPGRSVTASCFSAVRVFRVPDKDRAVPFAMLFWDFARATPELSNDQVRQLALSEIMPIVGSSSFNSVMRFDLSEPGLPRVLTVFTQTLQGHPVHSYLLQCDTE